MWFAATDGGLNSSNEWQASIINGANSYQYHNGGNKSFSFTIPQDTPDVYIYFKANPGSINVTDYEQGQVGSIDGPFPTGTTITLTAPAFGGQFYNLDATEVDSQSGITYNLSYAVEEITVEGFSTQYSTDGENYTNSIVPEDAVGGAGKKTIIVKNTYIPVETEMTVEKTWATRTGTGWPDGATVEVTLKKTVNG